MLTFAPIDYIIFVAYGLLILGVGLWVSRDKDGIEKTSNDYFLAGNTLPFWAVGASLIASNISAEQFIGMSGSGYKLGLAIAIYEWIGALGLIVLGKWFLPIYLKKKIFTMPQFLDSRYDSRVRTSLAVFWLALYVFVNLTSVMYLGALMLNKMMGVNLWYGVAGLALFSILYSIYGGLKAVAWTDVIQVVFLLAGGLITTFLALKAINVEFGGSGIVAGLQNLYEQAPGKFDLIISQDNWSAYEKLPGLSVILGGMWIVNINYFGCNQYITQRALAAKNLKEAQRGTILAGYMKILMPLIVVIPGIAAYLLTGNGLDENPDAAYPWLLKELLGPGLTGLVFAALIAAIVSSLSSMINSTSSIFTMDIYKVFVDKNVSEKKMVLVGRIASTVALIVAACIAPFLINIEQAFQFIQEFTGWVSPGIVVIFLGGFFWKRMNTKAALWVAGLTLPLAAIFKIWYDIIAPKMVASGEIMDAMWLTKMPFLDRMGINFIILAILAVIISVRSSEGDDHKAIDLDKGMFKTGLAFNVGSIGILLIIGVLYFFLH